MYTVYDNTTGEVVATTDTLSEAYIAATGLHGPSYTIKQGTYVVATLTLEATYPPYLPPSEAFNEMLFGVFVTALEGGIGYWSQCETYHWCADGNEDLEGFYADIVDEAGKAHHIDGDVILRGLENAVDPGTRLASRHRKVAAVCLTAPEEADFDIEDADVIVQLGLFGEVVYG